MNNKFLFTVILTSLCLLIFIVKSFAQDKTEVFKVSKDGTLRLEISGGDIHVTTTDANEVKVSYDDDEYNGITVNQDGSNVTVRSDSYIDFEITVPSDFNLNLNTSGGDIDVTKNIKGDVTINTSGGDITVMDVNGLVSVTTSGGDIKCGNIKGDAKVISSGGDIVVGSVEGECKLSTGGGNISVGNVDKKLTIATGGGNVKCGSTGSDLNIVTGGGNVSVDNVAGSMSITTGGGNVIGLGTNKGGKVSTGSGEVNLKNVSGAIEINSGAGNVTTEFVSAGSKESKIISGYGNVTIYIPENAKVTIEAAVKFSEGNTWTIDKKEFSEIIKSDFKASNEDKRKGEYHAIYLINGGGTNIYVQTSIGHIEIRKLKR